MNYSFVAFIIGLAFTAQLQAQDTKYIEVDDFNTRIDVLTFTVDSVFDQRTEKQNVWTLPKGGIREQSVNISFSDDPTKAIRSAVNGMIPGTNEFEGISLIIEELFINERTFSNYVVPYILIKVSFVDNGVTIATEEVSVSKTKGTVNYSFESLVEEGIKKLLIQFVDNFEYPNKYAISEPSDHVVIKNLNRNVLSLGYQIGGWTLIGAEYEIRVADHFGLNFGLGFKGYGAGLSFFFSDKRESAFLNLSYNDGGFGLINSLNAEIGFRIPTKHQGNFGFHLQMGVARTLNIDGALAYRLGLSGTGTIFSFGAGVCFW